MQIRGRKRGKREGSAAQEALAAAEKARGEAVGRLADAAVTRVEAEQQARDERAGLIADLRELRRRNNLARLILDSAEGRHHK